jgi:hypothetical protein
MTLRSVAIIALAAGRGAYLVNVGDVVLAAGSSVSTPSLATNASPRAPADTQRSALGVQPSGGSLARVFGPTFGGVVYGFGIGLPFVTASLGLGLGALLTPRISLEARSVATAPA